MSSIESDFDTTTPIDPVEKYYYAISTGDDEEGEDLRDYYGFQGPIKYRTEDFISRPHLSPMCNIEENILEFDFSYGYDCKKPYNLVVIDERTIIFASGNLLHFFDVETLDIWFRRSAKGGGIGHIDNNKMYPHFAVGENGTNPPIIIYEWPSLEIVCVLRGGTSKLYTHLNYSPNGDLLVSQGGEPDYLITVWNWPKSVILLRTRSYMNDVLRVMFSPYVAGQLTSSGVAHIKFWKIAKTFTGLKLQGDLGRFGKTEYSDIVGIYPMPDEKVISGCHWGNILVWEEGLIKLEVCRKNRKRCHDDSIVQFNYHHGELWTVSLDGHVKMWYYDTIDQADPPDEDRFCLMEPTYDFHTPGARFMCIAKQYEDPENTYYFAQDAKGAIWRIDLNIEEEAAPSERLLKSHAGITKGLAVCPWGPYFSTIGIGGWVHLYNYVEQSLLMIVLFPAPGAQIFWVPMMYDPSGEVVLLAFGDGTVRVGVWKIDVHNPKSSRVHIIQIAKSHSRAITVMSLNRPGNIFVTGGEDKTIFVFKVVYEKMKYLRLVPIGKLKTTDIPTSLTWHNFENNTIIIGCIHGQIMTVELPTEPVRYTTITYELQIMPITQRFYSYKSQIQRNALLEEINAKKAIKREKKMEALKKIRNDNPGLDIDEDVFLEDSESEEELPELYFPEEPNRIYWIQHTEDDTLWVSMAGYDAGIIYEYKIGQSDPVPYRFQSVDGAEHTDIANYVYSKDKEYLLLAMIDGSIRVNRVNPDDWHDLSNYWKLNMHDNYNGYIPGFSFSYDNEYFLTSGNDGNVFAFKFNPEDRDNIVTVPERIIPNLAEYKLYDNVNCNDSLSLEESIVKGENDRISKVANENKAAYMEKIQKLRERYEMILIENEKLPDSQKLTIEELTVDSRVMDNLEEALQEELSLVRRKLEFSVEKSKIRMEKLRAHFIDCMDMYPICLTGIRNELFVRTIKEHSLGEDFHSILATVEQKILESNLKGRPPERGVNVAAKPPTPPRAEKKLEYFLSMLPPYIIQHKLGPKINRLLRKYRQKKEWKENRKREWQIFNALKPTETTGDEDEITIQTAEEMIGDFKLKSAPNFKVPLHLRETTFKKYKQLLLLRERTYNLIHGINMEIFLLREEKRRVYLSLLEYNEELSALHEELLESDRIAPPPMFEFGENDYPEANFEIKVTMIDKNKEEDVQPNLIRITDDIEQRGVLLAKYPDAEEKETFSEWEYHLQKLRYRRKLYEQQVILRRMNTTIDHFDTILRRTRLKLVELRVEADVMELHVYTLNQELLVLKECEQKEDYLAEKVNQKLQELMDFQDETSEIVKSLESYKKEMDKLFEQEKELNKTFFTAVSDNKFFDFLRRIFKKKYKPPKVRTDDDSDSDSSSSDESEESEEEDAASIDSKDFNIIRLDENICPKGCDPNVYELTFQLRGQRHEVEQQIKDFIALSETCTKNKEGLGKKLRVVENELKKRQDELELFQREKQRKLNQIMCTVILKLSQMKHLKQDGGINLIKNTLVFSQSTLTGLYHRVGVLEQERIAQTEKHKLCLLHLKRMESDLKLMGITLAGLKKEIVHVMKTKFGSVVVINELEEYLLKKMIFDLRLSLSDYKGMFDATINQLYEVYKQQQKSIMRVLKQTTASQDLLCLLKMEKAELTRTNEHQKRVLQNIHNIYEQANLVKVELMKLDKIIKDQYTDIEMLKKEIKMYNTKGFVLFKPKYIEPDLAEEEVYEEQSFVSEWNELDDYMYTETYAKEYWTTKQEQEAHKTRQEVIFAIMEELFKNMKIQLQRNMIVNLLKCVISDVMNKCDVKEIIDDIIKSIPNSVQLTDEQNSLIELTAEKLYTIEEFDEDEEINEYDEGEGEGECETAQQDIMDKLTEVANMVFAEGIEDPVEMITHLIYSVLDAVPLHIMMEDCYMEFLLDRVAEALPDIRFIDKEVLESVRMHSLDSNILLADFLDRVFLDVKQELLLDIEENDEEEEAHGDAEEDEKEEKSEKSTEE